MLSGAVRETHRATNFHAMSEVKNFLCASKANLVNDLKAAAASGMISSRLLVCVLEPVQT